MNKKEDCPARVREGWYSRRELLASALALPFAGVEVRPREVTIASPDGNLEFQVFPGEQGGLRYRVLFNRHPVIEDSTLSILVDGIDLGQGGEIASVRKYRLNGRYPSRGVHAEALNRCHGATIAIRHAKSKTDYTVEARVFNDGIAFRSIVPGAGKKRLADETTNFNFPPDSIAWYHDLEGHYEGIPVRKEISGVQNGEWAAVPLTVKLPKGAGYASITEAGLVNYAGMSLQADGRRGFSLRLGHAQHVSYPFRLRYASDVERLKQPALTEGAITTPWRVVMIGADLNTLVNCDIVSNLSPPPDKTLFPEGVNTNWLKPGRAVWKYLDGGENTLEEVKRFSSLAGQLGFEYQIVEGFWSRWTEAQMRDAVEVSRQHKVGLLFWKHSKDLRTPAARKEFFDLCQRVGVVGAKVDFFDHEAKEVIDLYHELLREAAARKLMLNFHGANKPAGESRTWPNEMTREGIYGMEHRRTESWGPINTVLPFTRMLAGHADYTPALFSERRKETSWTHQIATAAIFTSPLLVYGAHPKNLLANPAVEIIKSLPSVWDQTIALPVSEIGEVAAFARRQGTTWFLAILNGATARSLQIPLRFLGKGSFQALLARDRKEEAAAVDLERGMFGGSDTLSIDLRPGGGFIGRFSR